MTRINNTHTVPNINHEDSSQTLPSTHNPRQFDTKLLSQSVHRPIPHLLVIVHQSLPVQYQEVLQPQKVLITKGKENTKRPKKPDFNERIQIEMK
jgi:hypothetical protein